MAAVVQQVGNDNGGGATTLVITIAATGAGNHLSVCFVAPGTISSVSDSASQAWTQVMNWGTFGYIYQFPNTASGVTSVTITFTTGVQICGIVSEISRIVTATPVDKSVNNAQTGVTSWTSTASATTTQADFGLGFAWTANTATATFTAGSGWTAASGTGITSGYRQDTGLGVIFVETQDFPLTGAFAATGTNSPSTDINAAIVLLKETTDTGLGQACL